MIVISSMNFPHKFMSESCICCMPKPVRVGDCKKFKTDNGPDAESVKGVQAWQFARSNADASEMVGIDLAVVGRDSDLFGIQERTFRRRRYWRSQAGTRVCNSA